MTVIWAKQALTKTGWQRDTRVTVDGNGRIASVEPDTNPEGLRVDVLLPAPVNAHSHAFQRAMAGLTERRGPDPSDSFWTWRKLMYRFLDQLTPEHVEAISAFVQMEMLEAGYATNVEFHYLHHQPDGTPYADLAEMARRIVEATKQTGIGLTLLPVFYERGGCDGRSLGAGQVRFGNDVNRFLKLYDATGMAAQGLPADCRTGVAPHSLRAAARESLSDVVSLSAGGPVHMHLAEQSAEVDEVTAHWGCRPVEWLLQNQDIDEAWCLIHCTQMQPHETVALAQTGAVAGLCPITESSLGDGIFDGVRWAGEGGRIAVGSDSNIRISLSEELRTLEYSQRLRDKSRAVFATNDKSTGRYLFEAVAQGGAQAAGRGSGQIASGDWADLLAFDASGPDLTGRQGDAILDSFVFARDDRIVSDVWSAGRHMVKSGRHVSRTTIIQRYADAVGELQDAL